MNKKESLKKVIKPLIKECLKEVLVEEGLISVINETKVKSQETFIQNPVRQNPVKENLHKQTKYISNSSFNPFEGTVSTEEKEKIKDEGINISSLINENSGVWNDHLEYYERKKA